MLQETKEILNRIEEELKAHYSFLDFMKGN